MDFVENIDKEHCSCCKAIPNKIFRYKTQVHRGPYDNPELEFTICRYCNDSQLSRWMESLNRVDTKEFVILAAVMAGFNTLEKQLGKQIQSHKLLTLLK